MPRECPRAVQTEQVHMKKLTATAAALAAGMTIFAFEPASAAPQSPRMSPSLTRVAVAPVKAAGVKKAAKRATRHTAHKAAAKTQPRKKHRAARRKATIDMATTASISAGSAASVAAAAGDARQYAAIVSRYAASYGVAASLAHAVIKVESNYRPGMVGSAGEIGLMQIKPATARMMGYSGSVAGLHDPETNIRYGMKYLAMAQELGGGSTCGTILKYNAGHGAKRMNPVSSAYCRKVKAALGGG